MEAAVPHLRPVAAGQDIGCPAEIRQGRSVEHPVDGLSEGCGQLHG